MENRTSVIGPEIWREGEHIKTNLCGGFWDHVPDENLEQYAADESGHDLNRAFAAATLAIRRFERLARKERIDRATRMSA